MKTKRHRAKKLTAKKLLSRIKLDTTLRQMLDKILKELKGVSHD